MPRLRTLVSRIPSAFTADSGDNNHGDQNAQTDSQTIICGSDVSIEFAQSFFGPCLAACLPFGTISAEPSPWNRDTLELQYKSTHATVDREPPPSTTQRSDILVTKLSRWRPLRLPFTAALGASRQTRLRGVTPPLLGRQKPPIEVKDNQQDTRVAAALAFVFC